MLLENLWPGAEIHMKNVTSIFFEVFSRSTHGQVGL